MSLKETINEKFREEFKTRIALRRFPYEVMLQNIAIAEKSGKYELPLTDEQIINLIAKECKERQDLLNIYKPGDVSYTIAEYTLKELSQYLPKQMSEEEVIEIIKKLKETESNPGKLIGLTVKEVGNRFKETNIAGGGGQDLAADSTNLIFCTGSRCAGGVGSQHFNDFFLGFSTEGAGVGGDADFLTGRLFGGDARIPGVSGQLFGLLGGLASADRAGIGLNTGFGTGGGASNYTFVPSVLTQLRNRFQPCAIAQ
jgi:uncharacterized protein YqeY